MFEKSLLDEIRHRLKVSEIVGRKFQLRKQGTDFVAVDNKSFTVNDQKRLWKDFGGSDEKGGDVFDFLVRHEGYSFVDAVKELAEVAGVPLPEQHDGRAPRTAEPRREAPPAEGRNEIVHAWDIKAPDNSVIYQIARLQKRLPDGSFALNKDGKIWKSFAQRRPSPEGDGTWLWGLDVRDRENGVLLEFMRPGPGKDWVRATDERKRAWKQYEVRSFDVLNVDHWIYNANEVLDELQQDREEQRTVFLPEGEGKVDVLREWGLLAACNTGGSKNFTAEIAEFFRGAADVVILSDNDKAGIERVAKVGKMLRAVEANVRVLNFRDVWPACPIKGDVKDWRDHGGGTRDALLEIVDKLKPWTPEPYKSRFGAKRAGDLGSAVRSYPWRIKGIVPMHDDLLIMGPSRSGKTFETLNMAMHVHFGDMFAGRKTTPGGVIYLTYEGASGFENRLRAYLQHHGYKPSDLHSFAWLTRPPNLFASEDAINALSEEVLAVAETFKLPLAATVVDTHNAASRGSSEIKTEDINRIQTHYQMIREKTGAPLWIVGHTNAEGKHRGNEQFFNGIEAALKVQRVVDDKKVEKRDDDGRVLRQVKIEKQREGEDGLEWTFVLKKMTLGSDEDGDPITSAVSVMPAQAVPEDVEEKSRTRPDGYYLKGHNVDLFKTLIKAISEIGQAPPPDLDLPKSVSQVITWAQLGTWYKKIVPMEEDETVQAYSNRIKARTRRFREDLMKANVIGIGEVTKPPREGEDRPHVVHYVWPTGLRVYGRGLQWPWKPKQADDGAPIVDRATGRPIEDIDGGPPTTVF